eukprot:SAG11_NODE_62_length_19006_cov_6.513143_30_plen_78_part_00
MEEIKESFKFLGDCAEIAEKLKENKIFITPIIKININSRDYPTLLKEIEEFVRVRVDKTQDTISITISDTEFIFYKK